MAAVGRLAKDLPPYSTIYWHVHSVARSWSSGQMRTSWAASARGVKSQSGRSANYPDSLFEVQNTHNANVKGPSKMKEGFVSTKSTNRIKGMLAVEYLGVPLLYTHTLARGLMFQIARLD
jgi:hypothetical protein